jgi:hypothetical protein
VNAATSLQEASLSTQEAAEIVRRTWTEAIGNSEEIDSTDKLVSRLVSAVTNIVGSKELRETSSKVRVLANYPSR